MSLRKALAALPDDRNTRTAIYKTVSFLDSHREREHDIAGIVRATGVEEQRIETVLAVFASAFVVDCDGDSRFGRYTFKPDSVLALEVRQFLRNAGGSASEDARMRRNVDRFLGRRGTSY